MENYFTNSKSKIVDSDRVLYTASTFARTSLFHLQEIGSLKALKPHVSSRKNLQSYCSLSLTAEAAYWNIPEGNMSLRKVLVYLSTAESLIRIILTAKISGL